MQQVDAADKIQRKMGLLSNPKSREKIVQMISKFGNTLCVLCYFIGLTWFLLLAYTELNAHTYFSENALLPGLVDPDFSYSDVTHDYYRELKDEVNKCKQLPLRSKMPVAWLMKKLSEVGLETYTQNYTFRIPFNKHDDEVSSGQNVYGILRAPKTAGTEALVLSAAFKSEPYAENTLAGIALMISLAQYFRQHTYWAKDIIVLVTDDDEIGMQAWLSAYHHTYNEYIYAGELLSRSGSIQAALNLEIGSESVSRLDVRIEGLNGQLPNLDLVNTVVRLCKRESITPTLHKRVDYWNPDSRDGFVHSLTTMLLSMTQLATGCPSGNHGLFHRYNIEAVTLRSVKLKGARVLSGFREMGRVVEGIYRSLNNLLERFHQSFFFYLLSGVDRYISIGLYMPPFGLLALPVVIKALALWVSSGLPSQSVTEPDSQASTELDTADSIKNVNKSNEKTSAMEDVDKTKTNNDTTASATAFTMESANTAASGTAAAAAAAAAQTSSLTEAPQSFQHLFSYIPVVLMSMVFGICAFYGPRYFIAASKQLEVDVHSATALTIGLCAVQFTGFISPLIVRWNLASVDEKSSVANVNLIKSLTLLLLSVLLGATAIINISLAFFIAAISVPVAIFIGPTNRRLVKLLELCLLVIISPVGAVCLASVLYIMLMKQMELTVTGVWRSVESGLMQSAVQCQLFDNWTFALVSLAYLPTWLLFWHILWSKPAAPPKAAAS